MIKAGARALFDLVESFFTKYLPQQRGASPHTIRAYRDALKLLLIFTAERCGCEIANLQLEHLNADIVAGFLDHMEAERSNSATTRNCRRTAIRGFFKHLVRNDLEHALQYTRVLALPAKKSRQRPATYLEATDVRAVIANPDRRTANGWRDYTLLLFLYNSGARVSEAIGARWADLQLTSPRQVRLRGKGRKDLLPIWRETADALHRLRGMNPGGDQQHVFVNHYGQPLTRDGVAYILNKHVCGVAARGRPTLARQRITPHALRHYVSFRTMSGNSESVLEFHRKYRIKSLAGPTNCPR
jgi:site-specific recombinase XerD